MTTNAPPSQHRPPGRKSWEQAQVDLWAAIEAHERRNGHPLETWPELLEVLRVIGYSDPQQRGV